MGSATAGSGRQRHGDGVAGRGRRGVARSQDRCKNKGRPHREKENTVALVENRGMVGVREEPSRAPMSSNREQNREQNRDAYVVLDDEAPAREDARSSRGGAWWLGKTKCESASWSTRTAARPTHALRVVAPAARRQRRTRDAASGWRAQAPSPHSHPAPCPPRSSRRAATVRWPRSPLVAQAPRPAPAPPPPRTTRVSTTAPPSCEGGGAIYLRAGAYILAMQAICIGGWSSCSGHLVAPPRAPPRIICMLEGVQKKNFRIKRCREGQDARAHRQRQRDSALEGCQGRGALAR